MISHITTAPAAASFDQYKSFEHRGEDFCTIVDGLVKDKRRFPKRE